MYGGRASSLGPRRSGGGADVGEEESAWYLLHTHARIYRTFLPYNYPYLYQQCVSKTINYSSKIHYKYSLLFVTFNQGSIWNLLCNLSFESLKRLGRKQSSCLSHASPVDPTTG